jgi:diguanylate cyclase (GGDEF)-like protein/PAS domain S-box-containing protein
MQNTLLDILILGLLVLLFGSIYRTKRTPRLRFWIAGWLCILTHFAFLLPNPPSNVLSNLYGAIGMTALLLGGLFFLLASSTACRAARPDVVMKSLLTVPPSIFVFASAFGFSNIPLLILFFLGLEAGILCFAFSCWKQARLVIAISVLSTAGAFVWAGHDLVTNQDMPGVYAALTQVYLINAVIYWYGFRRVSMGVVTAVVGLVAWAAVFPTAISLATWMPNLHLSGELWNVPKYFVEFGMILTLLEDEVIAMAQQGEEYRILFKGNPHPMWIFDQDTLQFLKVNDAAVAQYGYSQEEFLTKTLRDIRPEEDIPKLEHRMKEFGEETRHSGPWTHIRRDGSSLQVDVASHGIMFEGKQARFSLVQDVTESQQLHERLVYQAHHDILTGLPNRLLLKDRMEQTLASAERLEQQAAIVCMDLDRFKQINDTYGHHIGDVCLQQLAACLKDKLRTTDTVARSGGEEFTVLLGQLKSPMDAGRVAQILIDSFRQALMIEGHTINLTASIGIAMYPADGTEAHNLWRLADSAMYRAKRAGGNRYVFAASKNFSLEPDDGGPESNRVFEERSFQNSMQGD